MAHSLPEVAYDGTNICVMATRWPSNIHCKSHKTFGKLLVFFKLMYFYQHTLCNKINALQCNSFGEHYLRIVHYNMKRIGLIA